MTSPDQEDDLYAPWPADVQLRHDAGPYPAIIDLIGDLGRIAKTKGHEWDPGHASFVAASVRMTIEAYAKKYGSHGVPAWKIDDWLSRAPKLAKDLLQMLQSPDGAAAFAPVVDRGYPPGHLDFPVGHVFGSGSSRESAVRTLGRTGEVT